MAYCFDTSVLIECWSRSYPPDVFPGLWDKLDELIIQQQIVCPDEVRVELARQEDELAKWVNARSHMFVALDETIQRATSEVLAQHPLLMKATKNRNGQTRSSSPPPVSEASLSSPRRRAEPRASPRYPRYAKPSASHASTCSASSETRAGASRRRATVLPGSFDWAGRLAAPTWFDKRRFLLGKKWTLAG